MDVVVVLMTLSDFFQLSTIPTQSLHTDTVVTLILSLGKTEAWRSEGRYSESASLELTDQLELLTTGHQSWPWTSRRTGCSQTLLSRRGPGWHTTRYTDRVPGACQQPATLRNRLKSQGHSVSTWILLFHPKIEIKSLSLVSIAWG